jgi:hypothetical protein
MHKMQDYYQRDKQSAGRGIKSDFANKKLGGE